MKLKSVFNEITMPTLHPAPAVAVALLVVAMAAVAAADDQAIPLNVHDAGFTPAELKAPAGARVRIEVSNQTANAIEFESFELNRERVIQPGQTVNIYVSGLAVGRYEFFDDFHQERRGALVIE